MAIYVAYITVILIWSTTPLAIKLSNDSLLPIVAVSLRMCLAFVGGATLMLFWRGAGRLHLRHARSYALASLTIFPTMPLVYYAAQFISSGLISVLFGLMPLLSAVFAFFILGENLLSFRRVFAQLIALAGLVLISISQLKLKEHALLGLMLSLLATLIYSCCSVCLKKMNQTWAVPAFEQTVGALLFSLPGLLICWFLLANDVQFRLSATSTYSVLYLAVVGSLMGFFAYFWVLDKLAVSLISVIPVITPVLALWIGMAAVGEELSAATLLGAAMIIVSLIIYEGLPGLLWKKWRQHNRGQDG